MRSEELCVWKLASEQDQNGQKVANGKKLHLFLAGEDIVGMGLQNCSCADLKMEKQQTTENATKTYAYADELVWGLRDWRNSADTG